LLIEISSTFIIKKKFDKTTKPEMFGHLLFYLTTINSQPKQQAFVFYNVKNYQEFTILINDRCSPKPEEVKKMLHLLENGFSCVLLYNVGFMGFSKELIRTIGWWDERFIQGWEDRDWVWRIKLNTCKTLAYFNSSTIDET
jgi:GT2 family glycosyltransferase